MMSVPSVTRILHLENFHRTSDLNAKPDAITFSIALALIYNTISKTTRRQITKGWRQGRKDKKMRTMERQMSMLISLQKKSPDRCMNIDYSEHRFTDRTTRCPKSENRSESTGTWTCLRECAQRIDLACLVRAESYLRKDISNLSGCITS